MSNYIKHTWAHGEEISVAKMNNIEVGTAEANKDAERCRSTADNANKEVDALKPESWTFTFLDGSTVTKEVIAKEGQVNE